MVTRLADLPLARLQGRAAGFSERLRRRVGALVVDNAFRSMASAGRLTPLAWPSRHGVRVVRDVAYLPTGRREHLLDVYLPGAAAAPAAAASRVGVGSPADGPRPVVLYVHGGGFRILSKDSHWMMGLAFARRGYLVFNISYRLAPRHPYPAALQDACAAYAFVVREAARWGGDPSRLVLAGESAGANLVTALALAACYRRREPWARQVFDLDAPPRAVLPACGLLQVSDTDRFRRRRRLPAWLFDRLYEVEEAYLGAPRDRDGDCDLADPLCVLESGAPPDRPLPPFFAPVGTADPLLDDTRRLKAALDRLAVRCDAHYFVGEPHAFHAMVWRPNARRCWLRAYRFLEESLASGP